MESKKIKKKSILSMILFSILVLSIFTTFVDSQSSSEKEKVTIYFFWGDGCPHCAHEKPFLEDLQEKYTSLEVKSYETWSNSENAKLFSDIAKAYGTTAQGVPTTFIDDQVWVGYADYMGEEIEEKVKYCIENGCIDPIEKIKKSSEAEISESIDKISPLESLCIHVFIQGDCVQCDSISPFLDSLVEKQEIELKKHDVSIDKEKELYEKFKSIYGLEHGAYPMVFIGDRFLIGETAITQNLESEIISCKSTGCICPAEKIRGFTPMIPKSSDYTAEEKQIIKIPFFGEIDLSSMSLGVVTALIAFVDGFNPCSLWVLTFLLGIVIYTGSRKKIILVGLTFLFVTATAYGLFMLGLLNVFLYVGYLTWIKVLVALIAGVFAIVNIKDYFWYKKGISFTISDKYKPKIFKDVRKIMQGEDSTWAMISGTAIMALGIVLIELPCTAGFPVIWTSMMVEHGATGSYFAMLFLLYMAIYLIDELVVFGTVAFTLKASKFEEKHGRILKLIGGMIMLALAIILLVKPELMNDIGGALIVFVIAIVVSFIIMWLHRKILPKFGIKIGTEELENKTLNKRKESPEKENKEELKNSEEKNGRKN